MASEYYLRSGCTS